jgi:hypothetical protein
VLHEEDRHALVRGFRGRVGLAQQRDELRAPCVGDPGLGPGNDVGGISVTPGRGAHRLQVRTATGFGQGHGGADLAGGHLGQVGVFLFSCPVLGDELGHHRVPAHRSGQAHPAAGQLLGDRRVAFRGYLGLAPGRRDGEAEDAHVLHLLNELLGIGVGVLQLAHDRLDFSVDELPHHGDYGGFFLAQPIHGLPFTGRLAALGYHCEECWN